MKGGELGLQPADAGEVEGGGRIGAVGGDALVVEEGSGDVGLARRIQGWWR